jgi:predicted outer membrane repeat protein
MRWPQFHLFLLLALATAAARSDDAVVGNGTAASCNEAALDAAIGQLVPGANAPGGTLSFNCGSQAVTIFVNTPKTLGDGYGFVVDGGGKITLDGNGVTRVFNFLGAESQIQINNLVITGGNAGVDFGGAIYLGTEASLTLNNSLIRDCNSNLSGGAIAAEPGSFLTLNQSSLLSNEAEHGGAIASSGSVSLTDSLIALNTARSGEGGGLQIWFGSSTITRTRFESNSGINGGAMLQRGGSAVVVESSFSDNVASGPGGAIALYDDAIIEILQSRLERNFADQGGALHLGGVDQGLGNTEVAQANQAFLISTLVADNTARDGGGAYVFGVAPFRTGRAGSLAMVTSTFRGNSADNGGAIHSQGYLALYRSTIRNNNAFDGGGLYLAPNLIGSASGVDSVTGSNTLFEMQIRDNAASHYGGGIFASYTLPFTTNATISGNQAFRGGGVALVENSLTLLQNASLIDNRATEAGGGVYVETAYVAAYLVRLTLSGNEVASGGRGAQVLALHDTFAYPSTQTIVTLSDSTLYGGIANLGSALSAESATQIRYQRAILGFPAADGCVQSGTGQIVSDGNNVVQNSTCPFNGPGDVSVASQSGLRLKALADNGGRMPTHVPELDSPALDSHACPTAPIGSADELDQRLMPRGADGDDDGLALCDSGAIERQLPELFDLIFADGIQTP